MRGEAGFLHMSRKPDKQQKTGERVECLKRAFVIKLDTKQKYGEWDRVRFFFAHIKKT